MFAHAGAQNAPSSGAENTWQRSIRAHQTLTSVCHVSGFWHGGTLNSAAALNNSWELNGKYFGAFSWARRHNACVPVDGRFTALISKLLSEKRKKMRDAETLTRQTRKLTLTCNCGCRQTDMSCRPEHPGALGRRCPAASAIPRDFLLHFFFFQREILGRA